jgi:predicted negative regulator of RcsB-dependent stress response
MANIDVQKKKSNPLPWILLVLVILAIAGYFIWRNMENREAMGTGNGADTITTRVDTLP